MSRTCVAIVGAGPAGLLLGALLDAAGVDNVVLEKHTRAHVEGRLRAGVLEHSTVELLRSLGVAERLDREGVLQRGIELRFDGERRRIPLAELTGRPLTVYGQREVVRDLIADRLDRGAPLVFEAADVALHDLTSAPVVSYRLDGQRHELRCDLVAGCDGSHGVSAASLPGAVRHAREDGSAWLGILAQVAPSYDELVYASSEHGFALGSSRGRSVSRLYVECSARDRVAEWPDERVWDELDRRLASDGFALQRGPVLEKDLARVRSCVVEPVRAGRLLLAGDAAHVFPPMGAKGLNAAAADAVALAEAVQGWRCGDATALDGYAERCLRRAWRVQEFAADLTAMLQVHGGDAFTRRLQRARFERVTGTEEGLRAFATEYAGVPF